jgi:hypothetical protein
MTVVRNGKVEDHPVSIGMAAGGHTTPNGTYYGARGSSHCRHGLLDVRRACPRLGQAATS